ncbi:MAG: carbohydrate kinase [Myxococcota bacterium]
MEKATPHDVVCLGEALVDFLPDRRGRVRDVKRWTPCLGGAPANVAVGLARLGARAAIVGVTGDDEFGAFLHQGLAREGVDVSCFRREPGAKTGLGFVSLTRSGERSFVFYRDHTAEKHLTGRDTRAARAMLEAATVLHAGTNSLLLPPARAAVCSALAAAARRGQLTSSDPNLRLHLWPRPKELQALLKALLPACAVVKLSEEEIAFVTGTDDVGRALERLERRGVLLAVVTKGARGAAFRFRGETRAVPAPKVQVVDTTGAGDGFMAGLLFGLTRQARSRAALEALSPDVVEGVARFGCLVGSHAVTKLGAVAGLPRLSALARRST